MSEILQLESLKKAKNFSYKNFTYFGLISCLVTLVLAFLFKDYLVTILSYLEAKSSSNLIEFHFILLLLYIGVSLPILWGYLICILICSYVYSFLNGFILVVFYSGIGMGISFFICRYMFYDCAHQRVKSIAYLQAISTVIESNDKGFQIIFLSRIMPIPFGLVNTLFSVTDVQFKKYMLASLVGLMPTQLILCYMGSTLKSMSDVLVNEETAKTASLVLIVQLIIAIGAMYYILNAAKTELDKHLIKTNNAIGSNIGNAIKPSSSQNNLNVLIESNSSSDLDKLIINSKNCENEHLLNITVQS
jgi:protein maelstrom